MKQAIVLRACTGVLCALAILAGSGTTSHAQQGGIEHLVDDFAGAFSPDGKTIAFERWFSTLRYGVDTHPVSKRSVLFLMRADGSRKRVLRHSGATFEHDATFSPDGRSILFVRDERIYLMRRDGSGARLIRRDVLEQACPRFSPDGSGISLWRGKGVQSGAYFVMNADGSDLRRISGSGKQNVAWGCPSWFPDGEQLVFAKDYNLYLASADGTRVEQLTHDEKNTLYRPSVSPDGRWIACDGSIADRSKEGIFVMRTNGTGMRRITTGANEILIDAGASWSPDSSSIVFSGHRSGFKGAGVYVVRRDGSGLRRLSNITR